MAIIRCKMCGGDIDISAEKTFGTCECCGSAMTFPKVDDDQRAAAFNRGNHFRRIGEFDKALQVYERIVREDDSDAEAHWCCALSRFGIEYVEDPTTFEWLPTCHRASFDSFLEDVDYLAAVENSDGITRRQYQKDAAKIAEVQRGILATSQTTEPYDVFVCYKESNENGDRTKDSILAQDIYYQLTEQGRKVFFARITLEDVMGTQYEPYIFAALNSAKVMIVVGTKPEYLNAVWVKNEWSRFLAMMKKDHTKLLLPCYRDMDPYDLPEQLSVLQSYDMSKIGFIQDLIRGISKVLDANKKPEPVKETVVVQNSGGSNVAPLLKRAFMFLEDGDWSSANEYCEKVLDIDPECAKAYLGKLMAELSVKKQESLKDQAQPFDGHNNYQKAIRFADDKLKKELAGYIEYINTRNENDRLEGIYGRAKKAMSTAYSESTYKDAAELFASISEYLDSSALAQECNEKAEIARKDSLYYQAGKVLQNDTKRLVSVNVAGLQNSIKLYESLNGWRDSEEKIAICRAKIDELNAKAAEEHLERERQEEIARKEAEQIAKRNKKVAIIMTVVVCAVIAFVFILNTVIVPNNKYNKAVALMNEGKYVEAIAAFQALNGHKDSINKVSECNTAILNGQYNEAIALMDSGTVIDAYEALVALDGYKDSAEKANSIYEAYERETLRLSLMQAKVGDCVFFGSYEQDNKTANGKEDIEWLVLEVKGGKILLISRYALDCKPYNSIKKDVTWESCTLRKWLNEDFFNLAFLDWEKTMISTETVFADKNPWSSTDPGNATQDQVFLLSINEINKYFGTYGAACRPTEFAKAQSTYIENGRCLWWLRTPAIGLEYVAFVDTDGEIFGDYNESGKRVDWDSAVRPAMWIDLNAAE